jgi:hypothetical protein
MTGSSMMASSHALTHAAIRAGLTTGLRKVTASLHPPR